MSLNEVKYSIASSVADLRRILHLRQKIFIGEEGYPRKAILNGFEKDSLHVMAWIKEELIGSLSLVFDGPKGLPLERYLNLRKYKDKKVVEIDKLAVVSPMRKRELTFELMVLSYSIARYWGAERVFIFTLSKKRENLTLYKRLGFKEIGTFNIFEQEMATALILDFDDINTYEKKVNTSEALRLGRKLLNRFSLIDS